MSTEDGTGPGRPRAPLKATPGRTRAQKPQTTRTLTRPAGVTKPPAGDRLGSLTDGLAGLTLQPGLLERIPTPADVLQNKGNDPTSVPNPQGTGAKLTPVNWNWKDGQVPKLAQIGSVQNASVLGSECHLSMIFSVYDGHFQFGLIDKMGQVVQGVTAPGRVKGWWDMGELVKSGMDKLSGVQFPSSGNFVISADEQARPQVCVFVRLDGQLNKFLRAWAKSTVDSPQPNRDVWCKVAVKSGMQENAFQKSAPSYAWTFDFANPSSMIVVLIIDCPEGHPKQSQ